MRTTPDERNLLREDVLREITQRIADVDFSDKDAARRAHLPAVSLAREAARPALERWESELVGQFAFPSEVRPDGIRPLLIPVRHEHQKRLFRYAALHWSIPVSNGYGRRLRFLVVDEQNDKLMGIIGLGDPVFALRDRDHWIGWTNGRRMGSLRCVLDAFVLGAVPPYSLLLGGKLVAALATSAEVQDAFWEAYGSSRSLISGTPQPGRLSMLTTTAAFGRSSMYNRLRLEGRTLWQPVGYTAGHGEFLFSGDIYDRLRSHVIAHSKPSARHSRWGPEAWRNRREIVRKGLALLDLPFALHQHGLRRAIYVAPLGKATRNYLLGETDDPELLAIPVDELARSALERWVIPRAARSSAWRDWDPASLYLWRPS